VEPTLSVHEGEIGSPVGEVVLAWRPRPDNPFEGRLIRTPSGFAYWASDAGWFTVDPLSGTIGLSPGRFTLRRELRLLGIPLSLCAFELGDITIHAAAIEVEGAAVLLAGPSRSGKTTLAAAFCAAGHRLLAEDSTRCGVIGSPVVHPGPAAIRLREDVAARLRLPGSPADAADDTEAGDPGRVPIVLDADARGTGAHVPLAAILFLRSELGEVHLEPVPSMAAIRDLLALTFHPPTPAGRAMAFSRIADLVRGVSVLDLYRPQTIESLDDVLESVVRHVRSVA
jgi:hypothetical protein